ncbi:MAG TPA: hypothetical protein VLG71_01510, partial [Candidatus Limnocylindria bacterium]|nr:hypothetical protein [Candidatus Limnocylindria bacterium]
MNIRTFLLISGLALAGSTMHAGDAAQPKKPGFSVMRAATIGLWGFAGSVAGFAIAMGPRRFISVFDTRVALAFAGMAAVVGVAAEG